MELLEQEIYEEARKSKESANPTPSGGIFTGKHRTGSDMAVNMEGLYVVFMAALHLGAYSCSGTLSRFSLDQVVSEKSAIAKEVEKIKRGK